MLTKYAGDLGDFYGRPACQLTEYEVAWWLAIKRIDRDASEQELAEAKERAREAEARQIARGESVIVR